jgi:hypothetical protein
MIINKTNPDKPIAHGDEVAIMRGNLVISTTHYDTPEDDARAWRDVELQRTDALIMLPDYPNKDRLTSYRARLRGWPAHGTFPTTRPELD